jgi:hypothetical protein
MVKCKGQDARSATCFDYSRHSKERGDAVVQRCAPIHPLCYYCWLDFFLCLFIHFVLVLFANGYDENTNFLIYYLVY